MDLQKLTIIGHTENLYSLSNCVYINVEEWVNSDHVLINGKIFKIAYDEYNKVPIGSISTSTVQRTFATLEMKSYPVQEFDTSKTKMSDILSLNISIINISNAVSADVDNEEFKKKLLINVNRMVLNSKQKMYLDYDGLFLLIEILSIVTNDGKPYGIVNPATNIELIIGSLPANKKVKLSGSGSSGNKLFKGDLNLENLGIGGLDEEFKTMFRRAFASRSIDSKIVKQLGISHVKGILLYGPPGTGKTLLARKIGQILKCREPKIVNAGSLLNKYVGESEKNVRELFADAYADKGGTDLHLIIIDEADALCGQRGGAGDSTGVKSGVVNQLLTMLDGVEELDNFLVIAMTNRKDLIDDAILRPGRIEVHVEIGLPDEDGRLQILHIHTKAMSESKRIDPTIDFTEYARKTKNYTGAEIEALVKGASSYAISREINFTAGKLNKEKVNPIVTSLDFENAFLDIKPLFGSVSDEIQAFVRSPLLLWNDDIKKMYDQLLTNIKNLKNGNISVQLITGGSYTGKTTFACHVAKDSSVVSVSMINPEKLLSVGSKISYIMNVFDQATKANNSIIIIDSIEEIVEYIKLGHRFNGEILHTLTTLMKKRLPPSKKINIIITSSEADVVDLLGINKCVDSSDIMPSTYTEGDGLYDIISKYENYMGTHDNSVADVFRFLKYN
jgi:vesicle-fusing ATPase